MSEILEYIKKYKIEILLALILLFSLVAMVQGEIFRLIVIGVSAFMGLLLYHMFEKELSKKGFKYLKWLVVIGMTIIGMWNFLVVLLIMLVGMALYALSNL